MAKNVTLRHTNKNLWGMTVILPGVGATEIGKDGKFEVEETVATTVLNGSDDFRLVKGNGTTVTEEIHSDKLDEDNTDYVAPDAKDADEDDSTDATEEEETGGDDSENEEESDEETSEEETEESEEEDELEGKTLSELIEIAEAAEIPEEEYKKFKKNKKLMQNFLKKYLSEQE